MNVREIINLIIEDSCGDEKPESVNDRLICGKYTTEVTGIVTTFMATIDVIKKAIDSGANLIITHEPTFWTGMDKTDWLENDPLYVCKKNLIENHDIAIWRYHDYMHMAKTDRIYDGLVKELGWEENLLETNRKLPWFYKIKETTLGELAKFFKEKLSMDVIQIVGNPETKASKIGILVGGGSLGFDKEEMPMKVMQEQEVDVMVCGEISMSGRLLHMLMMPLC